ncbi:hypothetical protein ACA910_022399 [Epithemia clementina (nom. ined.)]
MTRPLRLDNAGENVLLQQRSDSAEWQLNITYEFTARATPQQNSLAEVSLATSANRGRAMMHRANIPLVERYRVWPAAFQAASDLDGLSVIELDGVTKTKYEHWCGEILSFAYNLRVWGEAGTVKIVTTGQSKIKDRGVHCMFIGYAKKHTGDTYLMWDPITKCHHATRDVVWLRRMFYLKPASSRSITINNHCLLECEDPCTNITEADPMKTMAIQPGLWPMNNKQKSTQQT